MTERVMQGETSQNLIASLISQGEHLFDPVCFRYIESMSQRALQQKASVALILEQKLQQAISGYQADLSVAREQALKIVNQSDMQFPDMSEHIKNLFQRCDFTGVKTLAKKLERTRSRDLLNQLMKQLLLESADQGSTLNESSFYDLLQIQEKELVNGLHGNKQGLKPIKKDLKSVRLFIESQEQLNSDKLVRQAIKEGPENPGPINPHMLAIRSLSTMQNLSPHYLKRFVSYIDTIFWLEEAGDVLKPAMPKKQAKKT